jgi:hypothetical protein
VDEFNENFIKEFAKKVNVKVNQVVKRTAFQIYNDITDQTAVGNPDNWKSKYAPKGYVGGRLRASLTISQDRPDLSTANIGATAIPKPSLPALKDDPTIFIANNLPYAHRVLMEGWSEQTPENMAENAVQKAYLDLKKVKDDEL